MCPQYSLRRRGARRGAADRAKVGYHRGMSRYGEWLDALPWTTTGRPSDAALRVARAVLDP